MWSGRRGYARGRHLRFELLEKICDFPYISGGGASRFLFLLPLRFTLISFAFALLVPCVREKEKSRGEMAIVTAYGVPDPWPTSNVT